MTMAEDAPSVSCARCGAAQRADARFCRACGIFLPAPDPVAVPRAAPAPVVALGAGAPLAGGVPRATTPVPPVPTVLSLSPAILAPRDRRRYFVIGAGVGLVCFLVYLVIVQALAPPSGFAGGTTWRALAVYPGCVLTSEDKVNTFAFFRCEAGPDAVQVAMEKVWAGRGLAYKGTTSLDNIPYRSYLDRNRTVSFGVRVASSGCWLVLLEGTAP